MMASKNLSTLGTLALPASWQSGELRLLRLIIAICCWIALWSTLQYGGSLADSLLTTNVTGLSIWAIGSLVRLALRGRFRALRIAIAIPAGLFLGSKVANLVGAPDYLMELIGHPVAMRHVIMSNLMLGASAGAFVLYVSRSQAIKEALERERRRAAEALQAETVARLGLLQAQIEPHFLFNTLANIHSLIKEDPETASLILEELNCYLRTSLRRTRVATSTVGEEIELIEALLAIAAVRLRARLQYTIRVSASVRETPLPPLLLQPLVENAIRHGIEPAVAGGSIEVEARRTLDALELTVRDTGVGFNAEAPQGVGLANVRARLASLYEDRGKLEFYTNTPQGVIARLIIPVTTK
jgi:signal transduction histidine kinase